MLRYVRWAALTVIAATTATSLHAEVKSASAHGFVIENAQVVPVDAQTAWKALVEDVDRWWPKDHTWWGAESRLSIQPQANGCFCEIAGSRQAAHMRVVFVDPGKTLRMIGGLGPLQGMGLQGALDWRFEPVDAGTKITLRYQAGGYSPEDISQFAPIVDKVQAIQLGGLADHLRKRQRATKGK
jgi:hypothetical protein